MLNMNTEVRGQFLQAGRPVRWKYVLYAGLIAGGLFLVFAKGSPWTSGDMRPTIIGRDLQPRAATPGNLSWLVACLHILFSVVYALAVVPIIHRLRTAPAALVGGLLGAVLYLLNYFLFTNFFPRVPGQSESAAALTHIAFGLVVAAVYKGMAARSRPVQEAAG